MKARPGSLDDMWLDGEANIPIEEELVKVAIAMGEAGARGAGEIRALRKKVELLERENRLLRIDNQALEEL